MNAVSNCSNALSVADWLKLLKEPGDHIHQEFLKSNVRSMLQSGVSVLHGAPSVAECHMALELLGSILLEESYLQLCNERDEETAFLALLNALDAAPDKRRAKLALWGLSRIQIPPALIQPHLMRVLELLVPYLTLASIPSRSSICSLYAVLIVENFSSSLKDGMREHADMWAPHLWRLMLAEPEGAEYWVEKRQGEFERLRAAALDCMKQMLDLLMRSDGVLAAVTPLQKLLVDDMKGSSAGSLCPGQAASPVTPAHSAPSTPRGKLPATHQVCHAQPAASAASGGAAWQGKGLVNVLIGMFAGDAPHEAIAAQEDAAHADGRQHVPPAGLPGNVTEGRKRAALATIPVFLRLLGGLGIVTKGVHGPVCKVLTAALQSNDEEFIGAAFESLQVLAEALISSKLVAGSEPRKIALSNPILVMLRKKNLSVKKMALDTWGRLLLVSFPEIERCSWEASDEDKELFEAFVVPVLSLLSMWNTRNQLPCLAGSSEVLSQVAECLCQLRRPDIVLLVAEALAGEPFMGKLASMLAQHPEQTTNCLQACLPGMSTFFTHVITVVTTAVPTLGHDPHWSKVLMLYCTKILEIPGIFTNAECQETSVSAVLHVFAQSAMTTASHHPQDADMTEVCHALDILKAGLTPAMLSCPVPSLPSTVQHISTSSNSGVIEEATPANVYLLSCWVYVILVAPSQHRATCVEKMQDMLAALDKSPVPVMHLQALLKSLKHHFRATADLAFSRQSTKGDQGSAGVRQQGSAATFTFSLVAHSLGYHLANTEEFEDSPDAAGSALQDACGALLLPISHWAGLASRVASEATAAVQNTSCTGNKDAKSVLAGNSEEGVCDLTDSPPRAEAAADAAVTPENSRPSGGGGAERGPGSEAGGALLENEAADIEQAWQALLDGMLAVAARKRSFKKEYCGDTARRITGIADRLPVNHTALACLQLASCAAHALTRQVQKSLPGKHAVDSAQLRRERLDVLRMLGVLLQQLLKHIERDASLAAACAAQVIKALAGLLRHAWEDFKVLDMLKLLEPLGAWLKETGSSTAADLGGALRSCWGEMLSAVAVQEQPQKSLAVALAHRPAYAKDMLRPLCNGFTHDCAQIRAASLELWQNPKIQCALGKHLAGLPPFVNESLARAQELGFASQPSQPAAKQQPHKAPRALLKQAEPPTVAAPQAKDPQQVPGASHEPAPVQEPPTTVAPPAEDPQQGPDAPDAPAPVAEPKKRPSNRLFQDTQTEYVRIESAGKRHRKNLLTDHQREVAARHRLGVGREGVTTFTRLDISQDAFSLINNSNTLDSVGNTCSAAADGGKGGPTVGHCHGSEEAANVNDSSVMEPVNGHAETSEAQLQASEGAVHPSGAADQAGLRASSSQAPMDMEAQEEAAKQDATANQRGSKSLQEAPVAGQDITQSSSQQERAQSPGTAAAVSPRGAQATGISQQQGQSPVQSTPHASVAVAESERGTDTSQKLSKGKENSGRARRLPHDQRQQQHWRKRRKAAQPVDQALPAATEPPGMHTSAAAETLQEDVSPDAQQPGSDAAVPAAAAGSSVEHVTAPAQPVEQPGTQQEQQQQPGSSAAQMQCSDSAQHGPDSANCMGAGDGISGVPAEAQTDHDAACADDMMQSTVPDSDHEVAQPCCPVMQHRLADEAETGPEMGSVPQTLLQTALAGAGMPDGCTAVPATAADPASWALPASALQGGAEPEAGPAGAPPVEETPAAPLPMSEADVQELQLTGLTQQLGQTAKLDKWTVKHTLHRMERMLAESLKDLESTVQSVMPDIKSVEAGERIGLLQQLDKLQQALIKGAGKLGDVRSQLYTD